MDKGLRAFVILQTSMYVKMKLLKSKRLTRIETRGNMRLKGTYRRVCIV